jgi:hypothetical protein
MNDAIIEENQEESASNTRRESGGIKNKNLEEFLANS